ncbi:hypothetical protein SAMN05444274_1177 [Mariniphaga anaerophila]|uniref:Uncharacterized protein n=1 Tax=Mariniphaga anaerophila TaxID=1484053 RepID=A0A1M5G4U1_9BACT|nr:hypothetical protein [Mariniphaga anaerophila]SHF98664.1 hypothetical protein SAMN05444274_1177 [Mariniphaga anaerophila]
MKKFKTDYIMSLTESAIQFSAKGNGQPFPAYKSEGIHSGYSRIPEITGSI